MFQLYRYIPSGGSSRSRFGLKPNDIVTILNVEDDGYTFFLTPKGSVAFASFPIWVDMEFWRVEE